MDGNAEDRAARSPVDTIEALLYAHSADLSPDASRCVWVRAQTLGGVETHDLVIHDLSTGTETHLGRGRDPRWSPDGGRIAFLAPDSTGSTQVFTYAVETQSIIAVTSLSQGVRGGHTWSPDGHMIAFAASRTPRDRTLPYRVTRAVPWRDGVGFLDDEATDVWVHDLIGNEPRRLTDDDCINRSLTWLPGTSEIAFLSGGGHDDWENATTVRAVSMAGVVRDIVAAGDVAAIAAVPATVGLLALATSSPFSGTPGELLVLRSDGSLESRTSGLDLDIIGDVLGDLPVPMADPEARILVVDGHAIVRAQDQDRLRMYRIALMGPHTAEEVGSSEGCLYPLSVAGDTLLHGAGDLLNPPDLIVRRLDTGTETVVSDTRSTNARALRPVVVERFWSNAPDGPPVQCKLLRPEGTAGPSPTVLLIHGGPLAAFGEVFVSDAALLCEAGFAVLLVNPRGSRGYGAEFSAAIEGDWGNLDYLDLMAAVDHAVEAGWADPDRLGVGGLSYGGFMTAWIIGHTPRFKAAVFENGVSNFWSMYGTSDVGLSFVPAVMRGAPRDAFDTYVRCSPISTAHLIVTPTLVIIGDQDHRCPPEQGLQLYSALKRAGCETELLILPGASHDGSVHGDVVVRRAQNEALLDWMLRFL